MYRHSSMYSRHSRNHVECKSVEVCTIMTRLGYGEEIRRWRVEKYREHARLRNVRQSDVTVIMSGSKAEGLTCAFESDRDILFVLNHVICIEAGFNLQTIPSHIDVFRMDTCIYPGHCRLLQESAARKRWVVIPNALCGNGYGDILLSSSLFLDECSTHIMKHSSAVYHERAGPSMPNSFKGFHIDTVFALRCHCPSVLQKWANRPRYWPSPVIVQKVLSLGAYVTATGFKQSEYKFMEWRICFNTGETELVSNLNDTQAKVYVILKMILKDIMKPMNKEITSYVLKNIVLWQAENTPQTEFHSRSLLYWLNDGLSELRTAIEKKQLRYYMIPERNLMEACGIDDALQHKWVAEITHMLEEGPMVILRLPKLRRAIVASPEPILWFSKKRMELEMLWLERSNRLAQCLDKNGEWDQSDFILNALERRIQEIMIEMELRMHSKGSSIHDQFDIFKRVLM